MPVHRTFVADAFGQSARDRKDLWDPPKVADSTGGGVNRHRFWTMPRAEACKIGRIDDMTAATSKFGRSARETVAIDRHTDREFWKSK